MSLRILWRRPRSSSSTSGRPLTQHTIRSLRGDSMNFFNLFKQKGSRHMTSTNALTAPTQYVEANGIRYAYRRFGKAGGVPLVLLQHFRGNMENWDTVLLDTLA